MLTPKIALAGTGNVGFHLARRLSEVGMAPSIVISRKKDTAQQFISQLGLQADAADLNTTTVDCDFFFLAVPDNSITHYQGLASENSTVIHMSGSQSIELLASSEKHGVMYPLQTISKKRPLDFSKIPFLIEGNNPAVSQSLLDLAQRIGVKSLQINSVDRKMIHLSAVIINNFGNLLFKMAQDQLRSTPLELADVKHLMLETVNNAIELDPIHAQTGPAWRGDSQTMDAHLEQLKHQPEFAEIYQQLSRQIALMRKE